MPYADPQKRKEAQHRYYLERKALGIRPNEDPATKNKRKKKYRDEAKLTHTRYRFSFPVDSLEEAAMQQATANISIQDYVRLAVAEKLKEDGHARQATQI